MTRGIDTAKPGPRPRPGPSWLERQQRRRARPWLRMVDDSFGCRLALAVCLAALTLGAVNRWERCRHGGFNAGCLVSDPGGVINVANVEALSIVSAAFLYVLEGGRRRRRDHVEAMELILACQQAGAQLSLARIEALEHLSGDGLWLDGLDLSAANLDGLQASHARWRRVNLSGASLRQACLSDADLQGSDLRGADLSGANLCHADLREADLRGARLRQTDLRGADLGEARWDEGDLEEALLDGSLPAGGQSSR